MAKNLKIYLYISLLLIFSCNHGNESESFQNKESLDLPSLLEKSNKSMEKKDYSYAILYYQSIIKNYPQSMEAIDAKLLIEMAQEEELWKAATEFSDFSVLNLYKEKYPNGKYISQIESYKRKIVEKNQDQAYQNAESSNSSHAWKSFLEEYPDEPRAKAIKRKIIQLEVDEIMGDKKTGQMPQFDQRSSGSSTSKVTITNNTGCLLTVRYSGSDVQSIDIPENETMSVHLSSGEYRIAASACGANYAGKESLSGNYSSSFYISSSRY